jgi:formylglycine-generating enzyme required for sulfatase activity
VHCAACDEPLPARARFCPGCGRPATDDDAAAAGDAGRDTTEIAGHTLTGAAPPGPLLPSRLLPPGTVIRGRYTVEDVLGEGGMGVVYRGRDRERGRTVAIKALHGSLMGDLGIRRRFTREAQLMLGWRHANVARVHDFIDDPDLLAFVMEHIDGPSLETYAEQWGGKLPYEDIRTIFSGVLAAMHEAHGLGIIHRDLKPQNILLQIDDDGLCAKIVDFGIAKILEGTTYTVTGAMLGTCRYMSPEQAQSPEDVDLSSDIYSIGVSLYRCITGRCPFETNNHFAMMMAHVHQVPEPPSHYRPHLPPMLEAVILRALAKSPADRPQSCAEMSAALDGALVDVTPARVDRRSAPPPVVIDEDGSEMLLVPGGAFQMGPGRRTVYLDAFYLARYPVTNLQFQRFLDATGYRPSEPEATRFLYHWRNGRVPAELGQHPVVFVSWLDARAYCRWAGRRLPSEAEWEKAARGTDGNRYPWGRDEPTPELANFGRARGGTTTAVDAHPRGASPYGMVDMAGNVLEWCEDVYDPGFYLSGPDRNPRNTIQPGSAPCVIRGGAWMFDARSLRTYARASLAPHFRQATLGFRVAL